MSSSHNTAFESEVHLNDVSLLPSQDMNLKLDSVDLSSIQENGEDDFSSLLQYCNNSRSSQSPPSSTSSKSRKGRELPPICNFNGHYENAMENALSEIMPDPLPTVQFASSKHPGNNRFYLLLLMHRKDFIKATEVGNTSGCDQIAAKIINIVYKHSVPNGRFLELNLQNSPGSNKPTYKILNPEKEVIDIVKWALREPPKPELALFFQKSACTKNCNTTINNDPFHSRKNEKILGSFSTSEKSLNCMKMPFLPRSSVGSRTNSDYKSSDSSLQSSVNSVNSSTFQQTWDGRRKKTRRPRDKKGDTSRKTNDNSSIFLKRRGTISSERAPNKKTYNLADSRFNIGTPLSKLVEEVVVHKTGNTASTCFSETSGTNSKGTVAKLGTQIGHFNIQDSSDTQTRRSSIFENEESVPTVVRTLNGGTRHLSQYDVLLGPSLILHREKNTGNFRLRTMLQMNKAHFHNPSTLGGEKIRIVELIIKNLTKSEGKSGSFVQEKNGIWYELTDRVVQEVVRKFLHKCPRDPNLQLPSLQEAFAKSLALAESNASCKRLQSDALNSVQQKRKKKKARAVDVEYVHNLQDRIMIEKKQRK